VPPIIVAQGLSKVYRSGRILVPALKDVSFAVERGEFVSIVGPSGSGKSTLFYLLGGLTRATAGTVLIDGVDFARLPDAERTAVRGRKIGFVFQKFNLLPTLTARDNIEIAYEISGRQSEGKQPPLDQKFLSYLAELLGIAGRLDHRPSELSGGEQQRVAIARALITRPALVLADEPTGNLDSRSSAEIVALLQGLARAGITVVLVTHEPDVAACAARIVRVRDGLIESDERHTPLRPAGGERLFAGAAP
jgi:putative ABC transport system ATP-binding protein